MLLDWIDETKLNYEGLSENTHDGALALLSNVIRKNPNDDKIYWEWLSCNTNDSALALLRENPDKIHWGQLSLNPNEGALQILQENQDKIVWRCFADNLSILKKQITLVS